MHWHILGPGAIGCLMAHRLARSGSQVTLLPHRTPPSAEPLAVTLTEQGQHNTLHFPWESMQSGTPISHLLVTTKAYAVLRAVQATAQRLSPTTEVLVLANGIGFETELKEEFPNLRLSLGSTTEGAYREGDWQVVHAGTGTTHLGRPGQTTPPDWFTDWRQALPEGLWTPNINEILWRKLAINCAINPLTAVHGCLNGELAQAPLASEVIALCEEIRTVAEACDQHQAVAALQDSVFEVIAATANNRSSMYQDIASGRRSEIDYITGFLLQAANNAGVAAPRNQSLFNRIHNLEEQRGL